MRRIRRQVIPGFGPEQLRNARMRLGKTQQEMAEHAQVSERTYSSWERGDVVPTAGKLGPLIAYLESAGINPYDTARDDSEAAILRDPGLSLDEKAKLIEVLRELRS